MADWPKNAGKIRRPVLIFCVNCSDWNWGPEWDLRALYVAWPKINRVMRTGTCNHVWAGGADG